MSILAGRLKHRIVIERLEKLTDEGGGTIEAWKPWANVWAAVDPMYGKEAEQAKATQAEITHKVVIRFLKGLTPDMRVRFKGDRIFNIEFIKNPREQNEQLELLCVEEVNQQ